ncbi:MAG: FAD-dependent oxidoreductase [Nocardia sp.]|uniref:FAD-dependent monooxygenase n=1 Tax=Nocardia sp. TaxID=1821 RepID=UPI002622E802|nr:FAD-dependent monooxygenase [Nocardia sp.]MCU1643297.1 FAD-dependent oxidoreductase [Nocardia sp.]
MPSSRTVLISGASIAGPALAYWLNHYGYQVTVVDRLPAELRPGSQAVDCTGSTLRELLQRMGILDDACAHRTGKTDTVFVDENGTQLALMSGDYTGGDVEILRGDLARISYGKTRRLSWPEQVQQVLAETIGTGDASLTAVARRLLVSPRTLQRYLAAADTTWRAQLDLARQHTAQRSDLTSTFALAHRLGYADARSLRRAAHRWDANELCKEKPW